MRACVYKHSLHFLAFSIKENALSEGQGQILSFYSTVTPTVSNIHYSSKRNILLKVSGIFFAHLQGAGRHREAASVQSTIKNKRLTLLKLGHETMSVYYTILGFVKYSWAEEKINHNVKS